MSHPPEHLSRADGYAVYRLAGVFTFERVVELIDNAIEYCVENEIRGLLVDVADVTGFPSPTTIQRFHFATIWSATAGGQLIVSMIAPPELIDPDHIGVTMASNRGLRSEVFTQETEAVQWLRNALPGA